MGRLYGIFGIAVLLSGCPDNSSPKPHLHDAGIQSDGTPCGDVCAPVSECLRGGNATAAARFAECKVTCEHSYPDALRACLQTTACDDMLTCFGDPEASARCAATCDRLVQCGSPDGSGCLCENYSQEEQDCIIAADCDGIAACADEERQACRQYCEKLQQCSPDPNRVFCEDACLLMVRPEVRDCVARSECDQVPACANLNVDLCGVGCGAMIRCGVLPEEERGACGRHCGSSWSLEARECVLAADCESLTAQSCGELSP